MPAAKRIVAERGRFGQQSLPVELVVAHHDRRSLVDEPGDVGLLMARGVRIRTRIEATPTAATSAQVDEPARPSTRSLATSASAMRSVRNAIGW